jgi:hypothetical protein
MIEQQQFTQLIQEIMQQGIDRKTAGQYAVLIGDTPTVDDAGNVLVYDEAGVLLATLKPLLFFGEI